MMKSFDKAAFDKVREMGQGGMGTMLKSVGAVSKTAQTMSIEWSDFVRQSITHSSAAMQALTQAKTPQVAMEIQTDYLKASCERMMAQAKTMAELHTGLAKELAKPLEGLIPAKMTSSTLPVAV